MLVQQVQIVSLVPSRRISTANKYLRFVGKPKKAYTKDVSQENMGMIRGNVSTKEYGKNRLSFKIITSLTQVSNDIQNAEF